jgi:hypothetical protein
MEGDEMKLACLVQDGKLAGENIHNRCYVALFS